MLNFYRNISFNPPLFTLISEISKSQASLPSDWHLTSNQQNGEENLVPGGLGRALYTRGYSNSFSVPTTVEYRNNPNDYCGKVELLPSYSFQRSVFM